MNLVILSNLVFIQENDLKSVALILLTTGGLFLISPAQADSAKKAAEQAVSAVGSARSQDSGMTRDHAAQVVTDNRAKLQWEDNAKAPLSTTWKKANEHCVGLDFAGHKDWRLATTKELVALAKATKVKFPKKPILKNIPSFDRKFWTSDVIDDKGSGAVKAVDFGNFDYGKVSLGVLDLDYTVRCVRNFE